MTIAKDRSFTFTIDRKSYDDTMMTMEAGRALRRQIDEVVIPEVDTYRIGKLVSGADASHVLLKQLLLLRIMRMRCSCPYRRF